MEDMDQEVAPGLFVPPVDWWEDGLDDAEEVTP